MRQIAAYNAWQGILDVWHAQYDSKMHSIDYKMHSKRCISERNAMGYQVAPKTSYFNFCRNFICKIGWAIAIWIFILLCCLAPLYMYPWGPEMDHPPLGRSYLVEVPSYDMSCALSLLTGLYGWDSMVDIDINPSLMGPIFGVWIGPTLGVPKWTIRHWAAAIW